MRSNRLSYKPILNLKHAHLDFASLRLDVVARSELPYASMFTDTCELARVSFTCLLHASSDSLNNMLTLTNFLRKEVIQPHLPIRLPCYDFTPVIEPAFGGSVLTVRSPTSGIPNSHGVTGGVYKTRERIHRDILIRDY